MTFRHTAATAALLLAAAGAQAHPGHGAGGLADGLLHPLLGADHLLAMVAVGLWSGLALRGARAAAGPLLFLCALAGGALLAMHGIVLPRVEAALASSVVLLAVLLLPGRGVGAAAGLAVVALAGLLHGQAHGVELRPGQSALAYGAGFMASSAALHAAGLVGGLRLRALPARAWRLMAGLLGGAGLWMLATRL